ncbi:unnamed protein product [Urochloa humidicola]
MPKFLPFPITTHASLPCLFLAEKEAGTCGGGGASCWSTGNLRCSFRTLRRSFRDDPIWQDAEQQNPSTRVCTHGSLRAAADPIGGSRCSQGMARQTTLCSATVAASRSGDLLWSLLPAKASDPDGKPRGD